MMANEEEEEGEEDEDEDKDEDEEGRWSGLFGKTATRAECESERR